MERQNQPSTSDDSFENYYLQEHYLEDNYIIPGFKDQTSNSPVNYVSNLKKSWGIEEQDEVRRHAVNEYFRCLDKNVGSNRFKNRVEKSSRRDMKPSSLPSRAVSTRRRINLIDSIKQGNWKVTGKRSRYPSSICKCNGPSLPLASPKYSRTNCVVEEESEAVNLLLGLKELINQAEELGGPLFKKRKVDEDVDETEDQDSSYVNKIKPSLNNESDMKKTDHIMLLQNTNCSVDSVDSSRPQNPVSPKNSDVKESDHHNEKLSNLNSSEDIKQPLNPMCADDSEIYMMPKDKKNIIKIVIAPRAKKPTADSKTSQESEKNGSDGSKEYKCRICGASFKSFQALGGHKTAHRIIVRRERVGDDDPILKLPKQLIQESQKRGSDDSKEYKCEICAASFKSFQALGGHKSSHTTRVRRENVTSDDSQVKEKNKIEKSSCGGEEVASHGRDLCPKSLNTLKQLKMHQRCHGLNVGSHDHGYQLPSTPSTVLLFDLNEPAPEEDSDFSSPVY